MAKSVYSFRLGARSTRAIAGLVMLNDYQLFRLGADLEPVPAHSLGTKRAKSKYTSRPVPAHRNSTVKNSRHTKDSMPFIGPIPPHTPAIHRSLRLRRNVLTADTNGGGGPEPVFPALNNRSLARANSSSVNAPRARSSSSLFRSSLKVIAVSSSASPLLARAMRCLIGGSSMLRLFILARRFVFYFLSMMLNDATGGGPHYSGMPRYTAHHTPHGGALQATLRTSHRGQQCETHGKRKAGSKLTHIRFSHRYR